MKQRSERYSDGNVIRVLTENDGTVRVVLIDIAVCAGYNSPYNFRAKCTGLGKKLFVRYKRVNDNESSVEMRCITYDEYISIAERYAFPDELTLWLKTHVWKSEQARHQKKVTLNSELDLMIDMMYDLAREIIPACQSLMEKIEKIQKYDFTNDDE